MTTQLATEAQPTPSEATRTVRVLVIDDNVIDIEIVSRCLRKMDDWGAVVTGCTSIEQAIECARDESHELLFLDYWLQGETGLVALRRLRDAGVDLPTILMTGMRGEAVLVEALHAGVVDYLPKSALTPNAVQRATRNAIEKADLARSVREKQSALLRTVEHLEARQAEIESFYHNVSHELKTPLTGAREFVSLVLDGAAGPISDDQADLLQAAKRNCDRMVTCINDMLDASRLDTGKLSLHLEELDIAGVIDDAVLSLRPNAESKDVALTVDRPNHPVRVEIDGQRVYQVITNLVGNAIKFSEPGHPVAVRIDDTNEDCVRVEVVDQGCGLDAQHAEHVFDRLYQSREADAATLGGLGMGLYICRQIVELHGGEITVSSAPGLGSTFRFHIPRRPAAPHDTDAS